MEEQLIQSITDIREDQGLLARDEASIKTGVVLRLLHLLEWNVFDVSEVAPEYGIAGERVDFALRAFGSNKIFIEVKRPREDLEKHQEQLLSYSFAQGVKLAALTNGTTWWLYLPLSEGSWEHRRFYSLDLLEQDPGDVVRRFVEFLSKARVISGEAVFSAERVFKSAQTEAVLRAAIPKAWGKLVTDPDDSLVDLLIETTERMCGLRPELPDIERFLSSVADQPTAVPRPVGPAPVTVVRPPRAPAPVLDGHSFINRKIESFVLFGTRRAVGTWQEMLLAVAGELHLRHSLEFDKCLELRGPTMLYFSKNSSDLKDPRRIADSSYFAESKLNSNSIVKRSLGLIKVFGHSPEDLPIDQIIAR